MRKLLKDKLKDKKGFTLVEILVVLAIMAILIAIAVPVMANALNDAKDKATLSDARAAYIAYELKRTETTTVTIADINDYIGKKDADGVKVSVEMSTETGKTDEVKTFCYTDSRLKDKKYVQITLGDKGTIEKGAAADMPGTALPAGTTANP